MLPFGGTFDLVQLKGSTLKKAFEHSVYRYGQSTGEFLQVGGKSAFEVKWVFPAGWLRSLLTRDLPPTQHECIVLKWS